MDFVEKHRKSLAALMCVAGSTPMAATVLAMDTDAPMPEKTLQAQHPEGSRADVTMTKAEIKKTAPKTLKVAIDTAMEALAVITPEPSVPVTEEVPVEFADEAPMSAQGPLTEGVELIQPSPAAAPVIEDAAVAEPIVTEPAVDKTGITPDVPVQEVMSTEPEPIVSTAPQEAPEQTAPETVIPAEPAPEQTPVEAAPVETTPVETAPVEQAPAPEAPIEQAPIEQAPVPEVPVEQAPAPEAPAPEPQPVPESPAPEQTAPEAQPSPDPYQDLNQRIADAALQQVGVTDGLQCTQVVQAALAGAGVQDAYQLWPDEYAGMYGHYTDTPEAGNLIYYDNGGRGWDHIAVYIGDGQAVHGNFYISPDQPSQTIIYDAEIPGAGAPQYIQVQR